MRFVIINKILFTAIYYENEIPFCGNDNFFSAAPYAHWQPIGNAEYTWGPSMFIPLVCFLKLALIKKMNVH